MVGAIVLSPIDAASQEAVVSSAQFFTLDLGSDGGVNEETIMENCPRTIYSYDTY